MASKPRVIILWVHPRSTSTMFECALLNVQKEFRVLHEPLGSPWYFGPERQAPRFDSEESLKSYAQYADATFKSTWNEIVTDTSDPRRTFSKDMAQYIFKPPHSTGIEVGWNKDPKNPTLIPTELLMDPSILHTFLIRRPEKAVPSYYRLCTGDQAEITDFHYYDPDEAGFTELKELFDFVKDHNGTPPLLIDSDDLIKDPKYYLRKWCEHTNVEYSDSLLEWNDGTREHFAKWPGFHVAAENSKGIGRGLQQKDQNKLKPEELPDIVKETIQNNELTYSYLKSFALPHRDD